jgi:hypothetical protein
MLISVPFLTVIAGGVTLALALKSSDGVVADDYYKQGLAVNQVIHRDQAAQRMNLKAEIMRSGRNIRVFLTSSLARPSPQQLTLRLAHPTRSGMDQNIVLTQTEDGYYSGQMETEVDGRWHVFLEDQELTWRLLGDWQLSADAPLQLFPRH